MRLKVVCRCHRSRHRTNTFCVHSAHGAPIDVRSEWILTMDLNAENVMRTTNTVIVHIAGLVYIADVHRSDFSSRPVRARKAKWKYREKKWNNQSVPAWSRHTSWLCRGTQENTKQIDIDNLVRMTNSIYCSMHTFVSSSLARPRPCTKRNSKHDEDGEERTKHKLKEQRTAATANGKNATITNSSVSCVGRCALAARRTKRESNKNKIETIADEVASRNFSI